MSIYADSKKHLKGGVKTPVSSQLQVFSIVPNQEFVSNSTVPAIVIDKSLFLYILRVQFSSKYI